MSLATLGAGGCRGIRADPPIGTGQPAVPVRAGTYDTGRVGSVVPMPGGADDEGMPTTLLLVDDDAVFRALARRRLALDGFEVVGEAGEGVTAVRAARALRPDVVLLDVQLPEADGFEVTERLAAVRDHHDRADLCPGRRGLR
jgi:response regulator receiver domain-containing protein